MVFLDFRCMSRKVVVCAMALASCFAQAQVKSVVIGYTDAVNPMKLLIESNDLEQRSGYKVQWKMYGNGNDVAAALAKKEIQIGELSSTAALSAARQPNMRLFWLTDVVGGGEGLVARKEVAARSLRDLQGRKVGVPFYSSAHYQLFGAMAMAGLGRQNIQLIDMGPTQIKAAWDRKEIDAAFVWSPLFDHLKSQGDVMLSAADTAKKGFTTFDAMVVQAEWAAAHGEFMGALVASLDNANRLHAEKGASWGAHSDEVQAIARWTQVPAREVLVLLQSYIFPSASDQASRWLENRIPSTLESTALFYQVVKPENYKPVNIPAFVTQEYVKPYRR